MKKKKILINCGDSWANGDYCWIDSTNPNYDFLPPGDRSGSYVNLLAKFYNFDEVLHYCCGGHSNDHQIYYFKKEMRDNWDYFKKHNTHVLWGTTSLTRFFFNWKDYFLVKQDRNFFKFQEKYLPFDFILDKLINDILSIKDLCNANSINFNVYNSFNTYDIPTALFEGKDLLSLIINNFDNINVESTWNDNDLKTRRGVDTGLLDPKTKHPSKQGSIKIASLLIKELNHVYS